MVLLVLATFNERAWGPTIKHLFYYIRIFEKNLET